MGSKPRPFFPSASPLPHHKVQLYALQILDAASFLNSFGFPCPHLHLGNILLSPDGSVRITDYELALLLAPSFLGCRAQPKPAPGTDTYNIDPAVVGFGHCLFEMLTASELTSTELAQWERSIPGGSNSPSRGVSVWDLLERIFLPAPGVTEGPSIRELRAHAALVMPEGTYTTPSCAPPVLDDDQQALLASARELYAPDGAASTRSMSAVVADATLGSTLSTLDTLANLALPPLPPDSPEWRRDGPDDDSVLLGAGSRASDCMGPGEHIAEQNVLSRIVCPSSSEEEPALDSSEEEGNAALRKAVSFPESSNSMANVQLSSDVPGVRGTASAGSSPVAPRVTFSKSLDFASTLSSRARTSSVRLSTLPFSLSLTQGAPHPQLTPAATLRVADSCGGHSFAHAHPAREAARCSSLQQRARLVR